MAFLDPLSSLTGSAGSVVKLVQVAIQWCEDIKFSKSRAQLLKQRLVAIRTMVIKAPSHCHDTPAMHNLVAAIKKVQAMLQDWNDASKLVRVLKVKKFKDGFTDVLYELDSGVHDMSAFMAVEMYNQVCATQGSTPQVEAATQSDIAALVESFQGMMAANHQALEMDLAKNGLSMDMLLHELRQLGCDVQPLLREMQEMRGDMRRLEAKFDAMCEAWQKEVSEGLARRRAGDKSVRLPKPCLELKVLKPRQQTPVASGGFSSIFLATYDEQCVAVKVPKFLDEHDVDTQRQLKREAYLLSNLRSPCVVAFYGLVPEWRYALVMEYMQHGSLQDHLKKLRTQRGPGLQNEQFVCVDATRLTIAVQIASAVDYLHSGRSDLGVVVHGDLKTGNLLMDSNGRVKLCDFGCSVVDNIGTSHTQSLGKTTARALGGSSSALSHLYSAPEQLQAALKSGCTPPRNVLTDIYSLGAVLFEVFTCTVPFSHLRPESVITFIVNGATLRMHELESASTQVADIIKLCMSLDPASRPLASHVVHTLRGMLEECQPYSGHLSIGVGFMPVDRHPSTNSWADLQSPQHATPEQRKASTHSISVGPQSPQQATPLAASTHSSVGPQSPQQATPLAASTHSSVGPQSPQQTMPLTASTHSSVGPQSPQQATLLAASTHSSVGPQSPQQAMPHAYAAPSIPAPFSLSPEQALAIQVAGCIASRRLSEVPPLLKKAAVENRDWDEWLKEDQVFLYPLHWAASVGYLQLVEVLLSQGKNVQDKRKKDGTAALHEAASQGHAEVVKALLAAGADMNAKDDDGWTALHGAAGNGHAEVVKALLAAGVDLNATDNDGWTALHLAALHGHAEVVKALLAAGADVNPKDNTGWTALHWAAGNGHAEVVKALLAAGADVNPKDNDGLTALHFAVSNDHAEVVKALLAAGAGMNVKGDTGWTALHLAANYGYAEVVKALLAAGADVNAKDNDWRTALYSAAANGHAEVVKALLAAGADVNAIDKGGDTPMRVAKDKEIKQVLKSYGAKSSFLGFLI